MMREKNLESGLQREFTVDYYQVDLMETSVLILKCEVPGKKSDLQMHPRFPNKSMALL